ncbi:unnamed protein product [Cladocopium goreaui]|uniref:C3H1-type domain-containing protein n=1 Tax=Cladocopium goreaui TaxID=2562237 RepID=A0A9P1D0Y8_9DINO|nr:unnamed protein product [Cladocopium goreaui]
MLQMSIMSMGSLSHPAFCNAPCVHMIKNGYCDAGASCGFCHLPHSKKVRLNKHQRQFLQSLDAGQKVVFIAPIILQKMEGFSEQVLFVEELKKAMEKSEREGSISVACKKQSRQVQLTRVLERMTTTALLELLATCLPSEIFRLYEAARGEGPLLHDVGSGPVMLLFPL